MKNILIIDVRAVAHAAKHAIGKHNLSKEDKPTFVLHGFLTRLLFLAEKTDPDFVVFALDSKKKYSLRAKLYPPYKNKPPTKEKTPAETKLDNLAYEQFIELDDYVLPELGFKNIFGAKGYEGDDIIARICKSYRKKNYITIATHDHDMYQCLRSTVRIFDIRKNGFYTKSDFRKEWGISPKGWADVKSIAGCYGDNVPNVPGAKEKTAIKFLHKKLSATTKVFKTITNTDTMFFELNKKLVKLPFKGTPRFKLHRDHPDIDDLKRICNKYGFKVLLKRKSTWKRYLNFS